jgi:hypothetical protein
VCEAGGRQTQPLLLSAAHLALGCEIRTVGTSARLGMGTPAAGLCRRSLLASARNDVKRAVRRAVKRASCER